MSLETSHLIGIVAGSGGPEALRHILSGLPSGFASPILAVMGIRHNMLASFVAWINEQCLVKVVIAEDGDMPEAGRIYVTSDCNSVSIVNGRLRFEIGNLNNEPKNTLFRSMARDLGDRSIAVILTGMGRDGTDGMKAVRDAGGYTIAQDEFTSIVYSTPRFALETNAACESLLLDDIASKLIFLSR